MFSDHKLKQLLNLIPHNKTYYSPIKGVVLHHSDRPFSYDNVIQDPSICIVISGEREIRLGEKYYVFDNKSFMFCPVDIPMCGKVKTASISEPFVVLSMKLDLQEINAILLEFNFSFSSNKNSSSDFAQLNLDDKLQNAFERLLLLLENPNDIEFIAPLIQKEIYYRLLTSQQGYKLKEMVNFGSNTQKIAKAIEYLKSHFRETIRIDELANLCGMSLSGFHNHFKKITTLSPLQYQKSLQLMEAKRLIFNEGYTISNAAYQVGYESPSQFSREYKRFFGFSPSLSD